MDHLKGVKCETAPNHARRFGRARKARAASILEDYTELIADLHAENGEARTTDIATHLGVAHPTASKTIARLKREGLVESRPYRGVFLTATGQAMAERSRQRHRLVVDLLMAIGAPREAAEADAEGIEHYVSEATLTGFRRVSESDAYNNSCVNCEPSRPQGNQLRRRAPVHAIASASAQGVPRPCILAHVTLCDSFRHRPLRVTHSNEAALSGSPLL